MADDRPRILLVEDDAAQAEVLTYALRAEGFAVTHAASGDAALLAVAEGPPHVVVLDWMLPGVSGIEVCRRLKRGDNAAVPVIMLSARGEERDRVRGLDTGADDYMVKPFSQAELIARIRTQLRRTAPAVSGARLQFGDIVLDGDTRRVTRAGQEVALGPTEFRLLAVLIERPGRVWGRDQLLDRVWGRDVAAESRTVDVHIGRLRKALCAGGGEDPVRTVRGAGYALG